VSVAVEKSGLDVATTKLVGIIQGQQLLALVEAPDGLGYILKPGDVLGNGRITDITANSVTFAVAGRAGQRETSLTLKLVKE
jgi:Tfp pilus assembly protein PilP